MGKKCKWCGKPIEKGFYCSDECRHERKKKASHDYYARTKKTRAYQRKCEWCGAAFETVYPNKKFCSQECQVKDAIKRESEKRRAEPELVEKTCVYCGTKFMSKRDKRRYCSEACKAKNKKERAKILYRERPKPKKKKNKREGLTAAKTKAIRDQGMTYAEWQMKQTLSMIEPIRTVL